MKKNRKERNDGIIEISVAKEKLRSLKKNRQKSFEQKKKIFFCLLMSQINTDWFFIAYLHRVKQVLNTSKRP